MKTKYKFVMLMTLITLLTSLFVTSDNVSNVSAASLQTVINESDSPGTCIPYSSAPVGTGCVIFYYTLALKNVNAITETAMYELHSSFSVRGVPVEIVTDVVSLKNRKHGWKEIGRFSSHNSTPGRHPTTPSGQNQYRDERINAYMSDGDNYLAIRGTGMSGSGDGDYYVYVPRLGHNPVVHGVNGVWTAGEVSSGLRTWQSLYSDGATGSEAGNQTPTATGFTYTDADEQATPVGAYHSSYISKQSSLQEIKKVNADGSTTAIATTNWSVMDNPGTYWLKSCTKDQAGNTACGTRYVTVQPKKYQVSYNGNGATSGSMANTQHTYDEAKTLTPNAFVRTHYNFTGWNTKANGSGTSYANGASVKNLSNVNGAVVILYAQWTPKTYTLTYDKNSPTDASVGNSDVKLSATNKQMKYTQNWGTLATATKPGYIFQGWYTAKTGGTQVTANTPVNGNLTVYAHWKPITYTIRFNPNAENSFGTVTGTMNNITATYDKAMKLPKNVYVKTTVTPPEGKGESAVENKSVFRGWNNDPLSLKAGYSDEATVMNLTKSNNAIVDLYAIWDDTPNFEFAEYPDRFFSLEEAQSGYITEEKLLETVKVYDRETKVLPTIPSDKLTGTEKGYVTVVGYDPDEYKQLENDGTVSVRYKVVDEVGNKAYLNAKVYITQNGAMPTELVEYYRSISDNYTSGLIADSRWVSDDIYQDLLNKAFTGMARPYSVKVSSETLGSIRGYVETNGFGNSKATNSLRDLFDTLFSE